MKYLLIRHGKTDANRLTRAAFGKTGAPLNESGVQQALQLGKVLSSQGVNKSQVVAISEFQRTKQTANIAGLKKTRTNSLLNEVMTSNPKHTIELVAKRKLPQEAIDAAKAVLTNPPKEHVWVTHGLLIAAIEHVTKQLKPHSFIPDFCEIIEIDI